MAQAAINELDERTLRVLDHLTTSSDGEAVIAYFEALYQERIAALLVAADASEMHMIQGRALELRELLSDIKTARNALETIELHKQLDLASGTPPDVGAPGDEPGASGM